MEKNSSGLNSDPKITQTETKRFLGLLSVAVGLLHVFFFSFFLYHSYTVMAFYNLAISFVYLLCFFLVFKNRFLIAITIALIEILIQTFLASYFLGNAWGFYLYNFIAIITAIFQSNQEELIKHRKFGKLFFLIAIDMISFYLSYYLGMVHVPIYQTKANHSFVFYILNSGFSFVVLMLIGFMVIQSAFSVAKSTLMDNKRLNSIASTDPLTNIMNRRSMSDKLEEFYESFERAGTPFSILMLDVDYFKRINDTYGHAAGDKVLIDLSKLIKEQLRFGDFVSRWGGEEFLTVLSGAGKGEALSVAERIRLTIAETPTVLEDGTVISYQVTIGISTVASGLELEELISEADKKLYIGKKSGRNRVVV